MNWFARPILTAILGMPLTAPLALASDVSPTITVGTQEVGLTAGYMFSHRLTDLHKTKQHGPALMPSWMITLTDPIGDSWYRGQISLGAEMVYLEFREPFLTHGVGFTPRIKYTFVALGRVRPYAEFAGGPFWTDLGGRIREEAIEFNFVLTGGVGVSWFLTSQLTVNAGYRFHHISNAGIAFPNLGLNASLPFIGFSFYF
ncbi:MAG: acyloxyacyl hydrolase [Nitrospira sp.]|nr:acyloxyacyl hydrolase [Nitrospira sp.]MBS0154019.1 acyloxyacyl hydrolase [Nitrospira sp.]MBS0166089.1 acyloxyacyl hydrolase [Nitrospira sp.]